LIKRLAIIPARGGSVRLKNKNIKLFYKKPIINHVINAIENSKIFYKIHVSTNSIKIKNVVEKNNIKIDFLRPDYLSNNTTPLVKVINYVLKEYQKKEIYFDEIWLIYSTAVLLESIDFKKAAKLLTNNKIKNLITVTKYPVPIEWAYRIHNGYLKPVSEASIIKDSKTFNQSFFENASFVAYKINKNKNYIDKISKFFPYELPIWKSADIDDKDDWDIAKKMYVLKKK